MWFSYLSAFSTYGAFAQIQLTIEKAINAKIIFGFTLVTVVATAVLLSSRAVDGPALATTTSNEITKEETIQLNATADAPTTVPENTEEMSEKTTQTWSDEDIEAMVTVLAGECYEDKQNDKRLVCEVILNRVSSDGFPNTIIEVVEAPNQFDGYWNQSRPITENDYEVAEQALEDWYENDCRALSEWLFFEAGDNHENVFRKEFN